MKFTKLMIFFSLASVGATSFNAAADTTSTIFSQSKEENIPFYLPINETQFPGLVASLQTALSDADLNHLKLMTTDYWHPYQNGIRQGRLGIYLAAPHFASWLVNRHNFQPHLKLAGPLRYVIAARQADSAIFEVNDLVNKTVCTNATMDISFLLVRESMPRSVLSAKTKRVESVLEQMRQNNKRCEAFSLSEHLFLKAAAGQPFKFIRLQQSDEFSNYAYLFHPKVSPQTRSALVKLLKKRAIGKILKPMHQLFSAEPRLVHATADHYLPAQISPLIHYWSND
jgi:hypothetical protein